MSALLALAPLPLTETAKNRILWCASDILKQIPRVVFHRGTDWTVEERQAAATAANCWVRDYGIPLSPHVHLGDISRLTSVGTGDIDYATRFAHRLARFVCGHDEVSCPTQTEGCPVNASPLIPVPTSAPKGEKRFTATTGGRVVDRTLGRGTAATVADYGATGDGARQALAHAAALNEGCPVPTPPTDDPPAAARRQAIEWAAAQPSPHIVPDPHRGPDRPVLVYRDGEGVVPWIIGQTVACGDGGLTGVVLRVRSAHRPEVECEVDCGEHGISWWPASDLTAAPEGATVIGDDPLVELWRGEKKSPRHRYWDNCVIEVPWRWKPVAAAGGETAMADQADDRWADLRAALEQDWLVTGPWTWDGQILTGQDGAAEVLVASHIADEERHYLTAAGPDTIRALLGAHDALVAARPPTAGEVLAHIAFDGRVEWWSRLCQHWRILDEPGHEAVVAQCRCADPSTPQPGLRLVSIEGGDTDARA